MIAAIIVYVLIVTLPLLAAAALTGKILRLWTWPVRGAWAVAALAIVLVGGRTILQQMTPAQAAASITSIRDMHLIDHASVSRLADLRLVAKQVILFPRVAAVYAAHAVGPTQDRILAALWCVTSIAMLAFICLVYVRVWRASRDWKVTEFAGQQVRVAPHTGPAVIGLFHPEIVVPSRMLESDLQISNLVIMHETEHQNARDPLLLAAMWALVALIPWHPGAWYCLARTRLAIELDCDARVVGRGASLRTYTELLLNQASIRLGKPAHLWLGATSLLEPSSHLERRLNAMILSNDPSHSGPIARCLRTLAYFAVVSTVAIAACESHVPTAADISGLDAASAETNARNATLFDGQPVTFYVNNVRVSADSAHAITAADISTVTISKNGSQQVRMITVPYARSYFTGGDTLSAGSGTANTFYFKVRAPGATGGQSTTTEAQKRPFVGAVIIDGVASDLTAMKSIDPSRIASIDVVKGPAAMQQSTDPRARDGLIRITLKH